MHGALAVPAPSDRGLDEPHGRGVGFSKGTSSKGCHAVLRPASDQVGSPSSVPSSAISRGREGGLAWSQHRALGPRSSASHGQEGGRAAEGERGAQEATSWSNSACWGRAGSCTTGRLVQQRSAPDRRPLPLRSRSWMSSGPRSRRRYPRSMAALSRPRRTNRPRRRGWRGCRPGCRRPPMRSA